jgi:hypothetical protein
VDGVGLCFGVSARAPWGVVVGGGGARSPSPSPPLSLSRPPKHQETLTETKQPNTTKKTQTQPTNSTKKTNSGSKAYREFGPWDWATMFLPCLAWLRTYRLKEYLLVRVLEFELAVE